MDVPITLATTARRWDEQHLDLDAASGQVRSAPTGGFTPGVAGAAARFAAAWAVRVSDGDVSAVLADVPDLGAEGDVLIELAAEPCVGVPEDDWQAWLRREDPGPRVG